MNLHKQHIITSFLMGLIEDTHTWSWNKYLETNMFVVEMLVYVARYQVSKQNAVCSSWEINVTNVTNWVARSLVSGGTEQWVHYPGTVTVLHSLTSETKGESNQYFAVVWYFNFQSTVV
jgi:hypothetical protein